MKKYGLIGKNISYSFSKIIHEYLIKEFNVRATYDIIDTDFISQKLISEYDGLNVTIPYKQEVIKYCNAITKIGVSNLIFNNQCYNVDHDGFDYLYKQISTPKSTVILGNGACAKLIKVHYPSCVVIDTLEQIDVEVIKGDLLINATPVGMGEYVSIVDEDVVKKFKAVIDLNYTPINSKLKYYCYKQGIIYLSGLEMLVVQAIRSFEMFNNINVTNDYINKIILEIVKNQGMKIAIVGMPLAGKSSLVKKYSGTDIDEEISKQYSIEKLIKDEKKFRKVETTVIKKNLDKSLICLGGGAIKTSKNLELLKNHFIIFLDVELTTLRSRFKEGIRPLLKNLSDVETTYYKRKKMYDNFSNLTLNFEKLEEFLDEYINN
ncbi:MAG: shikimate kinase [Bacilli bacterium]